MTHQNNIEIEIKALLGSMTASKQLIAKIFSLDSRAKLFKKSKQLNHYFVKGNLNKLIKNIDQYLNRKNVDVTIKTLRGLEKYSIRTRQQNAEIILVIKGTLDQTSSENGTARVELELSFPQLTLQQLDRILIESDFEYQAKWSREREEYQYKDLTICIDKNAGYGYLAEFEKVITDPKSLDSAKKYIRDQMKLLGVVELDQSRLERMFAFYNQNWEKYYGSDETFVIE